MKRLFHRRGNAPGALSPDDQAVVDPLHADGTVCTHAIAPSGSTNYAAA
ncbi:hypothetical protein [Streptomyces sp. NPDC048665]